jgi:hypothetical protein
VGRLGVLGVRGGAGGVRAEVVSGPICSFFPRVGCIWCESFAHMPAPWDYGAVNILYFLVAIHMIILLQQCPL